MTANILREFKNYPNERELIGSMLIAYAEIEFALFSLVASVLDAQDNAVQIFFRIRGEGARIEVSDAVVKPFLSKVGLGPKWSNAIGPMRVCKKIRNQYAHCHWTLISNQLRFIDFDTSVEAGKDNGQVFTRAIDLQLLEQQFKYFGYALDWLYYLSNEYQLRRGKAQSNDWKEPTSLPAPALYF